MMEFGLQVQTFSLGDAAHHTVSTVKTIVILPYTIASYNICCIFSGKLANTKILLQNACFLRIIKVQCKLSNTSDSKCLLFNLCFLFTDPKCYSWNSLNKRSTFT